MAKQLHGTSRVRITTYEYITERPEREGPEYQPLRLRESLDNHTRALDAICLAECVWWGSGEDLYRGWDHGIYEWRDLCWRMARWTHHAWEYVRGVCGECAWEFDVEFCPALVEYMLTSKLRLDPYADETDVLREFVKDITEAHEDE